MPTNTPYESVHTPWNDDMHEYKHDLDECNYDNTEDSVEEVVLKNEESCNGRNVNSVS